MSDPGPLLRSVLEELHLTRRDEVATSEAYRVRLEKSGLLEMMQRISSLINVQAGMLLIDVQSYLPPQVIVRSFTFRKGHDEHVMQVELVGAKTSVVFFAQERQSAFSRFTAWMCALFGVEKAEVDIRLAFEIQPDEVTQSDVEKWFVYLLWGLKRAFMPPAPTSRNYGGRTERRPQSRGPSDDETANSYRCESIKANER